MTQLSRERLEQYAFDDRMCNVNDEIREMARRLLAVEGQGQEPVAWEVKGILCQTLDEANRYVGQPEPLYTAPQPAPVAQPVQVPDEMTPEMMRAVQIKSQLGAYAAANMSGAYGLFSEFWQVACRAAMLNAEPVSQPYTLPQWIPCSERMPDNGGETYKLYLCWGAYDDDDDAERGHIPAWFVTNPNDGRSEWDPVEDDCNPRKVIITHWMPLPAAPQEPTK